MNLSETRVATGINCVYLGFMALTLLVIVMVVSAFLRPAAVARGSMLFTIVGIAAGLLMTVGKLLCLTAPSQMAGKKFIFVAVAIDLVALLLPILNLVMPVPPILIRLVNLISVAGLICFVLFLKGLGQFIKEPDISERADSVLIFGGVFVGSWLTMIGAMLVAPRGAAQVLVGLVFLLVLLVTGVMSAIRYAGLLNSCRYAVSTAR